MVSKLSKNDDGKFPAFAWPGGYPIFYLTEDCAILCPDCANGQNGSDAYEERENVDDRDPQWHLVAQDVHWEGADLTCEHCGKAIESAYGDPEAD